MVLRMYVLMTYLSLTIITADCQSFQYSKGWINGKRGDIMTKFSIHEDSEVKSPDPGIRKLNEKTTVPAFVYCDLQKFKIILQENDNDKYYLLPCELLNIPQRTANFKKLWNQLLQL